MEALERIRAIKQQVNRDAHGVLYAVPEWRGVSGESFTGELAEGRPERRVYLCELSGVDAGHVEERLSSGRCESLCGGKGGHVGQRYSAYALECLARLQELVRSHSGQRVLVQVAVPGDGEGAVLAGLWGLLKTAARENPRLSAQVLLVPAGIAAAELSEWLEAEKRVGFEGLIAYRDGARRVQVWEEAGTAAGAAAVFRAGGVYLITGGLGGLGLVFAQEILSRACEARVVLTGRTELSAARRAQLEQLGRRASYRQVDLENQGEVERLIAGVRAEHGGLHGIVHSAGMIADNFLLKKTAAEFRAVLGPKVSGTYHLDQASREVELDFFVLFSSIAGAMGNVGQGDYAAANGFMDHFAAYRNLLVGQGQRHGRTRSIDWSIWEAGGMKLEASRQEQVRQSTGLVPMRTATGLAAFARALELPHDRMLVAEGDLERMRGLLPGTPATRPVAPVMAAPVVEGLREKTEEFLRKQFSRLLKLAPQQIDAQAALERYGIDSILAMKLTGELEKSFGTLSKTLFFEYQTLGELSGYLLSNHSGRLAELLAAPAAGNGNAGIAILPPAPAVSSGRPVSRRRWSGARADAGAAKAAETIAIIGLSGRYPESVDIEAYWRNLREGKDCIVEVPKSRWDWREYFSADRAQSGHHFSKWGGFIEGVDEFDPLFFNISPKEAKYIDPQERLFLQHAWLAVEDAGYTRAGLQAPSGDDLPGQVGVYVGVMYSEYQLFGAEAGQRGQRMGIAGSAASIANRVSYALNLHGPSMTLDTMCSSSLTAIHLACQDLKQGRTHLAIAGGVNVSIHPNKYLALSAGQFLSSDGHCQSFGEGGDGYIPGEGVGVVVLKRLSEARRDGDHIYGVIRGSALNHGGKTNGYTVPNPQAQAGVIGRALAEAGIDARHIGYIEAHGTGTKLGDPIEIAALSKAFQRYTSERGFCRIGSAKSNIGHCESAAGVAGLTKVLLQMRQGQIAPSLHSARLNPHIDFAQTPFVVNQQLREWEAPEAEGRKLPRLAGISSFGAGGSNAHLLVEEYAAPAAAMAYTELAVVLSARTAEQLRQKARDLLAFVQARGSELDLASLAYTLQAGREAMEERLGLVARSAEELAGKLQACARGEEALEQVYRGQARSHREALSLFSADADLQQTIDKWIAEKKLSRLLDLWVKGLDLDWSKLFGETKPQRMSLPGYPFARERYWIDIAPAAAQDSAAAVLHPLLHRNTSDLSEQRYSTTFTGQELFLENHRADGRKVLPAWAQLEMARAAIEAAWPERPAAALLELRDVVWSAPAVVGAGGQIEVALAADGADGVRYEIFSREGEEEIVHCQGRGAASPAPAPVRLDGERLRRLAALAEEPYVLPPGVLEEALGAGASGDGSGARLLQGLESLRIVSPCRGEMLARVRRGAHSGPEEESAPADIDLCDARGNVCVELRGLRWTAPAGGQAAPAVASAVPEKVVAAPERTAAVSYSPIASGPVARNKPAGISLADPEALEAARHEAVRPRASVRLASTAGFTRREEVLAEASGVKLYNEGGGVYSLRIAEGGSRNRLSREMVAELLRALEQAGREPELKVLKLLGLESCFLCGGREEFNAAAVQGLYGAVAAFPYPVIAAPRGDASGAGLLLAAVCDLLVCNEEANYRYTDPSLHFYPAAAEAALWSERLGAAAAQQFLYRTTALTGGQLEASGWTCPVVPATRVEAHAEKLARSLAEKPQEALRLLKTHLSAGMAQLAGALAPVEARFDLPGSAAERRAEAPVSSGEHLRLEGFGEEVALIRFCPADGPVDQDSLLAELGTLFAALQACGDSKAIVLAGEFPELEGAALREFQRLAAESPLPVAAALAGDARGNAWLMGQCCDACVHSAQGVYSAYAPGQRAELPPAVLALLLRRLGREAGTEVLLTGAGYTGAELRQRVGALIAVEPEQVLAAALQVGESWSRLPRAAWTAWKQQAALSVRQTAEAWLAAGGETEGEAAELAAPMPIPLGSGVVSAVAHPDGIVVVKLEDREAKNMFSAALEQGVEEVFAHIAGAPGYKVVILTGYDTYFASGGTKESLRAIQEGRAKFTDSGIFQAALECRLPVIAAMQGHGIGAGWCMGMFADVVLLSEESRYVSPYMEYGFTPGAGATWVLPRKLGADLARESLLTAQPYTGSELRQRGLRLRILPRLEVPAAAMEIARQMAGAPRSRLMGLKRQWAEPALRQVEETCRQELAMHDKTFVGRADTLAQIEKSFHAQGDSAALQAAPVAQQAAIAAAPEPFSDDDALASVAGSLRTLLANELLLQESDIDEDSQFVDLGLDSISGVTWIRKINEKYRTAIEATRVYSHPTLRQLSRHVKQEAEKLGTLPSRAAVAESPAAPASGTGAAPATVNAAATSLTAAAKPLASWRGRAGARFASAPAAPGSNAAAQAAPAIAVIGMAGQFPQARNIEEFWRNLAEGRDCVAQVPGHRWDLDRHYQPGAPAADKTNCQWVGALEDYDRFDPLFFNISPAEAESMDPQQRLFLQTCWHTVEHAGYDARALSGSRCGVFAGCAAGDYSLLSRRQRLSAQGFTGGALSILAARISYFMNLQGPSMAIDTACSSSLVAIASACDSLVSGASDLALAGGVYVMAGPEMHIMTAQAGMLSPEGKCFTFDQRANGFVPGEGVGAVLLKRLGDAERDGDTIYGVIQGWGLNQDGKTNGITAPNPESQTRLEQQVYDKYRIDPGNIQLVEAHGTGTRLGDPIEVEALKEAFKKYTRKQDYCALGSVKSNIGHCLTAAGIAGFIKLLLALRHKQLPPTINFGQLNEHIDLRNSPFYVNDRLQDWTLRGATARQAAISAFGFSGTNAHIVIGEYAAPDGRRAPAGAMAPGEKLLVPLSARKAGQLKQKAEELAAYLRQRAQTLELRDVAYTLEVGREAMEERAGFAAGSLDELVAKLDAYAAGEPAIAEVYQGQARRGKDSASILSLDQETREAIVEKLIARKKLSKLLELWSKGLDLDWSRLYGDPKPRRIALPGYPFARERYWTEADAPAAPGPATAMLHPLLHANTSDLHEIRFSSNLAANQPCLSDHKVEGRDVLSSAVYLEMARAAIELAMPAPSESMALELSPVVWGQPIVISESRQVNVGLASVEDGEIKFEIYSQYDAEEIIHFRGNAAWKSGRKAAKLDLEQLKAKLEIRVDSSGIYTDFHRIGLDYGASYRSISHIDAGENQVLAQLRLPINVPADSVHYRIHPCLIEGALQAAMRLAAPTRRLPGAMESMRIFPSCGQATMAWVRYSPGVSGEEHSVRFDVDLLDQEGNVCVEIKELELSSDDRSETFASRADDSDLIDIQHPVEPDEDEARLQSFVPMWNAIRFEGGERVVVPESSRALLLGDDQTQLEWLRKQYPKAELSGCAFAASVDVIQSKLANCTFDQLIWIAPDASDDPASRDENGETVSGSQEQGVLSVFRTIKALLSLGYGNRDLQWTVIVSLTHSVTDGHAIQPSHAGIAGLIGSLAKEYSGWNIRLLDVDCLTEVSAQECLSLPWDKNGNPLAHRQGEWFRQELAQLEPLPEGDVVYRQNGVYVVIGGAGGLGEVWTRFMIERYQANVIWIGRREYDASIEARIDALSSLGKGPVYISADATKLEELQDAYRKILTIYPAVHGVVHSAIVLRDRSLARMEEEDFKASLSAKVNVSVNIDRVFGGQGLDFLLFFSSAISFFKSPGQSNYSAGCTFKDSFAQWLQRQRAYPVKTVNWGYWGNVGIVADESYRRSMEQMGIGSIEPLEAMQALQTFVGSGVSQLAVIKTLSRQAAENLISGALAFSSDATTVLPRLPEVSLREGEIEIPREKILRLRNEPVIDDLERWFGQLLFCQLDSMIGFTTRQMPVRFAGLASLCGVVDKYAAWWTEALETLCERGYLRANDGTLIYADAPDAGAIRKEWQTQKERFCQNADVRALTILVSDCMERLPEIIQGRTLATDIVFPNSSMEKVEAVYKNNPLPDVFNEIAGNAAAAYVRQRLHADPRARLRILEIGAGTGGTSVIVFDKLRPFRQSVETYCYTDLSQAFFFHAEENYRPQNPYLECRRLDIEKAVEEQGFELGSYDLVIASNVLHATRNIRQTIRNAKALLQSGGYLLLNEIGTKSLSAHLTFGLLDGWWLFEDARLRIRNCPALSPSNWKRVLEEEGFRPVQFPAEEAHDLGYQIVFAPSDGIVRQKRRVAAAAPPSKLPVPLQLTEPIRDVSPTAVSSSNVDAHIRTIILESLSSVLKVNREEIDADTAFSDYGIDSILGVKFIEGVNKCLSIGLNTAVIFEHSSLDRLSKHVTETYRSQIESSLRQEVGARVEAAKTLAAPLSRNDDTRTQVRPAGRRVPSSNSGVVQRPEKETQKSSDIAVIGMSGMFPGAENIHEFWKNLTEGFDAVDELPASYLDQQAFFSAKRQPGKTRCKWGGILKDRDCFDPLFFSISPKEAESMNPHQRLVLQEGWKALEDAGYNPKLLSGSQTGIFIGAEPTGYMGETFTGYSDAIIASRMSYALNLSGPAFVVNTGCSSSGVALHLACESLRNRETDMALAGGVSGCMEQRVQISLDEAGMLSPSGRCRTFDGAADGTIVSEAVAIVVLKRLEDAVRDGDLIHGVICGSGTNQDGASNGITAPNGAAQEQLIEKVYKKFDIDPEKIGYVEAHGTGTKLGDPVEANALVRAFRKFTAKTGFCVVGSAKSHIGHTAAAAGATGLIKVLLSIRHGYIPQLLHFNTLNPLIEFDGSPFYIPTSGSEWKAHEGVSRMAALNSFGHSGTNAHLVVREYIDTAKDARRAAVPRVPVMIPLSAKTTEQLRQKAVDLLDFIRSGQSGAEGGQEAVDLTRLSYTLQTGREAMEERLGLIVESMEQLKEKLRAYLDGKPSVEGVHQGKAKHNQAAPSQETIDRWISGKDLTGLLNAWVSGVDLNWNKFYDSERPMRLRLPVYPFAKERYWTSNTILKKRSSNATPQNGSFGSVEDVIDKIDRGLMNQGEGVRMLKELMIR
ncbi:MAG: SDR family NAD(P)-dependent oxidoreductase [Terracidiphilus sp.]|jgi:acyl transferase domain-containing protein/enoyl-CoA hydratase/carnithine racemase/acyl carrier protein/ubiquinone/menaquinone biosynthesis C-methylase UbiE